VDDLVNPVVGVMVAGEMVKEVELWIVVATNEVIEALM